MRHHLFVSVCAVLTVGAGVSRATEKSTAAIAARGSFSCDFNLPSDYPLNDVGPVIERDRMFMAAQPGFTRKQIPFRIDTSLTGAITQINTGGRYLFDTYAHAQAYNTWVRTQFALDGTLFLQRSYFLGPECHVWRVIGAEDLGDSSEQVFLRTERFSVTGDQTSALRNKWPSVLAAASQRGLTGVWLLYDADESLVQLVYFANRTLLVDPAVTLALLETSPPLGAALDGMGYTRTFDRTQWTLTQWWPYVAGDRGQAASWPQLLFQVAAPRCGDGVCVPSRGENAASCAADCSPHCGDIVCQPAEGENTKSCPSDCRL